MELGLELKTSFSRSIPNCMLISGGPIIVQVRSGFKKHLEIFLELILNKLSRLMGRNNFYFMNYSVTQIVEIHFVIGSAFFFFPHVN